MEVPVMGFIASPCACPNLRAMEVLSDLGNGLRVTLTECERLIPHEEIIEQRVDTRVVKLRELSFDETLVVEEVTSNTLDGHHKTAATGRLNLDLVPVILLNYLIDDRITMEVWTGCGRTSITKAEVLDMSASGRVFSPKTSRHLRPFALPELAVPLEQLCLSIHLPLPPIQDFDGAVRGIGLSGGHNVGHGRRRVRKTDPRSRRSGRIGFRDQDPEAGCQTHP